MSLESDDSVYNAAVVQIKLNAKKNEEKKRMNASPPKYQIEQQVNLLDDLRAVKGQISSDSKPK